MTFWILLAIMSLVAVGFAVWPLYKHQRGLTPLLGATVIVVVALSAGLYNKQGKPELLDVGGPAPAQTMDDVGDLDSAITGLAARLAENPNDVAGWKMLARSYLQVQNYGGAADAFERVLALEPSDPESLFYGGLAAGERGETELAASRWERLLETNPPADIQETIRRGIAEWRGEALPADHPPVASTESPAAEPASVGDSGLSAGAVVRANVSLSDAAAAAISTDTVVFVIARDVNVPVPPIAVTRRRVSELPSAVELGDRESMVAGRNLSGFAEFELVARVSLSGQPGQQPGDWFGSVVVKPAENNIVELLIDQEVQ
ncbi:MAG: tetratricopeptide repeat protein [Woeseiaceae bacterium]